MTLATQNSELQADLLLRRIASDHRGGFIQFVAPLPFFRIYKLLSVELNDVQNIKTELGFVWWCMLDNGQRPKAPIFAILKYAKKHGAAIVIHTDCTFTAFFHCAGLTFRRECGLYIKRDPEFKDCNEVAASISLQIMKRYQVSMD